MLLKLKYGESFVKADCRFNGSIKELYASRVASLQKPCEMIEATLEKPVVSYPFKRTFRRAKNLTIVVSGNLRPNATRILLPIILDTLNRAFVPDEEIKIFIANGADPALDRQDIKALLGEEIANRLCVVQNDAYNAQEHEYAGETKKGIAVFVNKHLLDADEIILCGTVCHHFITGYTGGPQLIVPGCAGIETINKICQLAFQQNGTTTSHRCMDGVIDGNPVYEEIRDAYRCLSPKYGIYTILNEQDAIIAAYAGDPLQAYTAGCRTVDRLNHTRINRKADLTIVSAGGAPKDIDFIKAYTALHRAYHATRDGGIVIFVAECSEGIGAPAIRKWLDERKNGSRFVQNTSSPFLNQFIATSIAEIANRLQIFIVSKLEREVISRMGFRHFNSLQEAINAGLDMLPSQHLTYLIPDGTVAVPQLVPMQNMSLVNS